MKRFVTYLYEYKDAQKIKNIGYIRMDVRNQMVNMLVNIRYPELANETGKLFVIVRDENVYSICIGKIQMKDGQYQGGCSCRYHAIEESPYSFQDAVGVVILFENGGYLASSWKEEADEIIAKGKFTEYGIDVLSDELSCKESCKESCIEKNEFSDTVQIEETSINVEDTEEVIEAAEYVEEMSDQYTYQKINLNEIATLPSSNWHFMNNSFLLHGFWNYGYLVLKETMEADQKELALGIPGIFEQPEMVMAAYFGFPIFSPLPSEVVEMEIGEIYQLEEAVEKENQHPEDGTFGCWFVNL